MKHIEFVINGDDVKVEAHGFKGNACEAATKAFTQVLGITKKVVRKPDYYVQPVKMTVKQGR